MDSFARIRQFVAATRRHLDRVAASETLLALAIVVATAMMAAFGLALLLDAGYGPWGFLLISAGAAAAVIVTVKLWVQPRRRRVADDVLALWIEERAGGMGSSLVTGVQVESAVRRGDLNAGYSLELARQSAAATAASLNRLEPKMLVSKERRNRLGLIAGSLGAVALVIGLLQPDFYAEGARRLVTFPYSAPAGSAVEAPVVVGQLGLVITPPAYTKLKPRQIPRSTGDFDAREGSEVRFVTTVLEPAVALVMVLESEPDARWAVDLADDGTVGGLLRVGSSDRYRFILTRPDGVIVKEQVWRNVGAIVDAPPNVRLLLPEADREVSSDEQVSFFFEADDDLGIDHVRLLITDGEGETLRSEIVRKAGGDRLARGDASLDVKGLDLEPGDSVDIVFEAVDLNAIAKTGPGIGRSAPRRLTLYSPDAAHDRLLASIDAVIDQMIGVLADRLESPVEEQKRLRLDDYVAVGQGVSAATSGLLNELKRLVTDLAGDSLAGDEMRSGVAEVRSKLKEVADQEASHLKKAVLDRARVDRAVMTRLLFGANEENISALEQGAIALQRLLDESRKESVMDAARELLDAQNEMMELLKKLKDNKDPEALKEAMKKIRQLQEKMQRLQQELAKLQKPSPYENQNPAQRPSDRQNELTDMKSAMDKIEELLAEGKVDEAMKLLEELNQNTQEMMAALQSDLESGGSGDQAAQKKMQEFNQALGEVTDGQRGVKAETEALDQAAADRQAKEMKEDAKGALEGAQELAKEIREDLKAVPAEPLHPADRDALEGLKQKAETLEEAIEAGRPGEAGRLAKELAEQAEGLKSEVGESEARESDEARSKGLQEGMGQLGEAKDKADALGEQLSELAEQGEGLSGGEGQEAARLEKRQQQLQQGLDKLSKQLGELDGESPGAKDAIQPSLDEAAEAMQEAKEQLGGKKPGGAKRGQQQALESLERAQQTMSERMQQQQREGGEGQSGVNDPKAKVAIPEEARDGGARQFRDRVIKAMKERAPENYREAVERFYQELVK